MPSSSSRAFNPVPLGFTSHLLAGVLPFITAAAIARLGLMPATASLYLAGSMTIGAALLNRRLRGWLHGETAWLLSAGARAPFALGLAGFVVAGVAYYIGLAGTIRVAEYIFLTRLDWLVQTVFALVWLREPWTPRGLAGAALALSGGLMLAWSSAFGTDGLVAAGIYIAASLAGYSCFKPLSVSRGVKGAVALTMWRHWINTIGFVGLAIVRPGAGPSADATGLLLAMIAGVVIVVLFLLRFTALTGLPLWVLSAQAPTQAVVAILVTLATSGTLPASSLLAIALIVAGEMMVVSARARG